MTVALYAISIFSYLFWHTLMFHLESLQLRTTLWQPISIIFVTRRSPINITRQYRLQPHLYYTYLSTGRSRVGGHLPNWSGEEGGVREAGPYLPGRGSPSVPIWAGEGQDPWGRSSNLPDWGVDRSPTYLAEGEGAGDPALNRMTDVKTLPSLAQRMWSATIHQISFSQSMVDLHNASGIPTT